MGEPEPEEAPVIDLMEALRQSVSEAQKKPAEKAKSGTRKRAAAAKK